MSVYKHEPASFDQVVNYELPWLGRKFILDNTFRPGALPLYPKDNPLRLQYLWRCEVCDLPLHDGSWIEFPGREVFASVWPCESIPNSAICWTCELGWRDEIPPNNWAETIILHRTAPDREVRTIYRRAGMYRAHAANRRALFWGRRELRDAMRLRRGMDPWMAHEMIEALISAEMARLDTSKPESPQIDDDVRLLRARFDSAWRLKGPTISHAKAALWQSLANLPEETARRLDELLTDLLPQLARQRANLRADAHRAAAMLLSREFGKK